ncbi:MAG: alpha/beta hydrolase [Phycisphaera sp.]|nr:MAG: alpha/beta hydrolase [Phycisphaera sp.]
MTKALLAFWCLLLAGCNIPSPLAPEATEPEHRAPETATEIVPADDQSIWPQRVGSRKGVVIEDTRPISNWRTARVPNDQRLVPYEIEREQFAAFNDAMGTQYTPAFEPGGGFVVIPYITESGPDGKDHFVFYSAAEGAEAGVAKVQRTWFTYDEPDDVEPIGLAVLMPGIFATPRDVSDRAERGLLMRGWAVLRMLSPPSRMTEHTEYTIDAEESETTIRSIALDLDNRAAEASFAVQSAAEHVTSGESGLRDKPRIIIGMSGTAIALPTIIAYEPETYNAAVVIGGGANSYRIAIESSYRDWIDSIQIYSDVGPPDTSHYPRWLFTYEETYFSHSRLDGVHTAQFMTHIPTLMIHGSSDTAVPASSGDLLWEKLGKPERWVMPVGHELLFAAIPLRMVAILDWLEENTGVGGEAR